MTNFHGVDIERLEKIEKKLFSMQTITDKLLNQYAKAWGFKNSEEAKLSEQFENDET